MGAIGSPDSLSTLRNYYGYGRVYELYQNNSWELAGQEIKGIVRSSGGYGEFGEGVALSSDGTIFAISEPRSNSEIISNGGNIHIFQSVSAK